MSTVLEVERHYSIASVATILDVSTDFVYARIADGGLKKVVELGSGQAKQRISASTLQAYLDSRTYGTQTASPPLAEPGGAVE